MRLISLSTRPGELDDPPRKPRRLSCGDFNGPTATVPAAEGVERIGAGSETGWDTLRANVVRVARRILRAAS